MKILLRILFLLLPVLNTSAQKIITGKIIDNTGSPLRGATVIVKGTNNGTETNDLGIFSITTSGSEISLLISFVGYDTKEILIGKQTNIVVQLIPLATNLNDVVVIGYGYVKKKDLTGATASLQTKDFNKGIYFSSDQLVQGKISGVQVTFSSGQPGGNANIKIRGNSALTGTGNPLIVLDGVPLDGRSQQDGNNPLNFLNPDDILSVDVLKDASAAAIYGARAAYGVVIINTKKGFAGSTKLEANGVAGISTIMKKINVLNAEQFRDALSYYGLSNDLDKGGSVDALDAVLQNGLQQNYSVAISGGTETGKYRLSGSELDQTSLIKSTGFKKYTADLSTNFTFLENKKLLVDANIVASQYLKEVPEPGFASNSVVGAALSWNPTQNLYNADGTLYIPQGFISNPVALTKYIHDNLKVTSIVASVAPTYKITKWLDYRLLLSINYSTGITRSSRNDILFNNGGPVGSAAIGNTELTTKQITHTLSINHEIIQHLDVNAVLGYEYLNTKYKGFSENGYGMQGIGFGNYGLDYTNYIQYSDVTGRSISSFANPTESLQSYFARTIFNYYDTYLLTITFRADGSSKFGENNRYGYFPSFAAAWNINKEKFFKLPFVNSLKLRAGWGKTGNQEFPAGSSQAKYSFFDNGIIRQVNNPNPDLKWQSDVQYNFGIDFLIFNNKISGTFDYFRKTTTNLLYPAVPIQPAPQNSVVRWINLPGKINNNGFEALINAAIISKKDFGFDISFNCTFLYNEVSQLPSTIHTGGPSGGTVEVIKNGLPMNAFYTRKFIGLDKDSGFSIYQDGGNTFYYVGNPNPSTLAGLTANLRYKKFFLTANMYGVFGQDIYFTTIAYTLNVSGIRVGNNIALSVYQDPVKESFANTVTPSSRYIYKGNFVKMGNLTFNYNLGDIDNVCKGINVFVTAQNLFILTKYPGFDPETNTDIASLNYVPSIGIDYPQYPTAKTFSIGIKFFL